jgi:integrase
MSRRAVVVPLPKGVSPVKGRNGQIYWYHQERRGKPDAGPRTRLPEFGTPEFWAAIAKLTGETKPSGNTIRALVDSYKAQPEWGKLRPNTVQVYEAALAHILTAWGDLDPAEITVAGVMALRMRFSDRPSMGNMVLIQVRQLMKLAVQSGLRSDNPAREVDSLEENPDEAKPLTPEAWAALTSDTAPVELKRLAILGRATGQRLSDLVKMRPADRDQDGIRLNITKLRDREHWCPLRPDEIETIDGWKQFRAATYLVDEEGRRFNQDRIRRRWNVFIETDEGKALAGFTPHDLRATKVCDERIAGKNHQQIAAMVGMSIQMVMKYSRHIDQRLVARGTAAEQPNAKHL